MLKFQKILFLFPSQSIQVKQLTCFRLSHKRFRAWVYFGAEELLAIFKLLHHFFLRQSLHKLLFVVVSRLAYSPRKFVDFRTIADLRSLCFGQLCPELVQSVLFVMLVHLLILQESLERSRILGLCRHSSLETFAVFSSYS